MSASASAPPTIGDAGTEYVIKHHPAAATPKTSSNVAAARGSANATIINRVSNTMTAKSCIAAAYLGRHIFCDNATA
jgi:hypothetical protein